MTILIAERLRTRVARAGAEPLLTYYELAGGVRVELSAVTFANWVAKTSNLLVDELLVDAGEVVELDLARTAPGHWITACWQLACWQVGLCVSVGGAGPARLLVTGPDWPAPDPARDVLACSLHPLGLGFPSPPPRGITDYASEVRGQPDRFVPVPVPAGAPAWVDPARALSQADLVTGLDGPARRRLVRPGQPWSSAVEGILTALVTGGSAVVVVGDDDAAIARIAAEERIDPDSPA